MISPGFEATASTGAARIRTGTCSKVTGAKSFSSSFSSSLAVGLLFPALFALSFEQLPPAAVATRRSFAVLLTRCVVREAPTPSGLQLLLLS